MADVITRVLADLAGHPGATAGEIAGRTDTNPHIVFLVLQEAEGHDEARRYRLPRPATRTWRWAAVAAQDAPARPAHAAAPGRPGPPAGRNRRDYAAGPGQGRGGAR
jgi:hypothetical protein